MHRNSDKLYVNRVYCLKKYLLEHIRNTCICHTFRSNWASNRCYNSSHVCRYSRIHSYGEKFEEHVLTLIKETNS